MTATDPTTIQRRVSGFASEMREQGIHVGINGWCVCGVPWPCDGSGAVPSVPAQPATPGQALRWAADRLDNMDVFSGNESRTLLRRWAGELDAAPAVYALPAEPPETVTELWDCNGERWLRLPGAMWMPDGATHASAEPWPVLVAELGPLSTAPPAGTEGEHDG